MRLPTILSAAALVLTGAAALAQVAAPPRDPNMPDPRSVPPERVAPPAANDARPGESLSDRLERTEGVIRPPANVDPEIRATPPVPNPGTTPVIRPPGEPGGNPSVQPR